MIQPIIEVCDEHLIVKVPLEQIVEEAESQYAPVKVTDITTFSKYLARYLKKPKRGEDDVCFALSSAIRAILDDATFMGAGVRPAADDVAIFIDHMWQDQSTVTINDGIRRTEITAHECVVEAIKAARKKELLKSKHWLSRCAMLYEAATKMEDIGEEAIEYAVSKYGSEVPLEG